MNLRRHLGTLVVAAGAIAVSMADNTELATAAPADGRNAAFWTYCIACHGVDGQGIDGLGVNLVASPYVASTPSAELVEFLKVGRLPNDPASVSGRPMPGFAYVDEAELGTIADYLKQRSNL